MFLLILRKIPLPYVGKENLNFLENLEAFNLNHLHSKLFNVCVWRYNLDLLNLIFLILYFKYK